MHLRNGQKGRLIATDKMAIRLLIAKAISKETPMLNQGYEIEPNNRYFKAVCSITGYELRHPGCTVTFMSEVDLTNVERLRDAAAKKGLTRPSYTAFVIKAVALSLRAYPFANRRISRTIFGGHRIQRFTQINASVLCERQLPDAPMIAFVDMIRDADQLSLEEISDNLRALATCNVDTNAQWRAFTKIIRSLPSWLAAQILRLPLRFPKLWVRYRGGAFVVSSPAKYGVDAVAATWPWSLGVSFGMVRDRPVVRDGTVVAAKTFVVTLNFDRRLMAGAQAARFFNHITQLLENANFDVAVSECVETGHGTAK